MRTLKNLLLALINATLILVALCLFLLWQLSGTAERVVQSFAQNLQIVAPLEAKITNLQTEVQHLRSDLASVSLENAALNPTAVLRLQTRAQTLENELNAMTTQLTKLAQTPDRLMSTAIEETTTRIGAQLTEIAACHLPKSEAAAMADASVPPTQ